MSINKRRISMREGEAYLDGLKVMDSIKLEAKFTPEVVESRALKERGKSRRWIGYDITGTLGEYRATPWLRQAVEKYMRTGITPEFTITGIQDDKNSEYYEDNGLIALTLSGCVLTGDITLLQLDSEGELVKDEVEFAAASMT